MFQFIGIDFGIIQYTDLVTEPAGQDYRLFLLENAVVAVDLNQDADVCQALVTLLIFQ